jgi:prepilin-type N-terminal cleavage/methylation domain-containing protein
LQSASADQGFTLLETLVALTVLLIVMGVVMTSMIQFSQTQSLVWNRANMHGAVRSATELLQQEVGQAGRVSLAEGLVMTVAVTTAGSNTVSVTSTANMFVGEQLVIDAGQSEETVTVTAVNSATSFTANFASPHSSGVPVTVRGGFASGVVPTTMTNGSTGGVLKIHGDINGDGNMVYIEYVCDTAGGNLYRNTMSFSNAPPKLAVNAGQILLTNVLPNPGGTPCFTYEQKIVNTRTYVINVAITLTTQTQFRDRITRQFQTETKALLNVAPRNVFEAWQLASMGSNNRIQPMPPSVTLLLP